MYEVNVAGKPLSKHRTKDTAISKAEHAVLSLTQDQTVFVVDKMGGVCFSRQGLCINDPSRIEEHYVLLRRRGKDMFYVEKLESNGDITVVDSEYNRRTVKQTRIKKILGREPRLAI